MKLVSLFRLLRSLPASIYFNFHYLPFRQAVRLPILLYKPRFLKLKGHVRIDSEEIKTGMVQLGFPTVSLYPNSGIMIENHGGEILFKGKAKIGNASAISIGPKGRVEFGERYNATAALKLTSYHSIRFAPRVLCAWECTFMDTDFHKLTKVNEGGYSKGYAPISIGSDTWFGMRCVVLKGTVLPDYCTIGAQSLLSGKQDVPSYSVLAGNPLQLKKTGVWRNVDDDQIRYEIHG